MAGSRCTPFSTLCCIIGNTSKPGQVKNHADNDGQNSPQRQSRRQMFARQLLRCKDRTPNIPSRITTSRTCHDDDD